MIYKEVTIADQKYRFSKINARLQFHVVRRLAPLMAEIPAARGTGNVLPILVQLRSMTDADVDYVLNVCLAVCERAQNINGAAATVWSAVQVNGNLMFDDLDASALLEIALAAIEDSLAGFFVTAQRAAAAG